MQTMIDFHRKLLNDKKRMDAYRRAIFETVKPGDAVLDIGTGSGILSFFACQAGAKRVFAVERGAAIHLARQLARENGFDDRIIFFHQELQEVELPEKVDVIVSELISKGVLGQQQERLISLARERHLKPGGALLPQKVDLWIAPVQVDELYEELALPALAKYDLDFSILEGMGKNQTQSMRLKPKTLLAKAQCAYRHDAALVSADTHVNTEIQFQAEKAGRLHGFGGWFMAKLSQNIELGNTPPAEKPLAWDNLILPLPEAVDVEAGMCIKLQLRAKDTPQLPRFWKWDTTITKNNNELVAKFNQSTILGEVRDPAEIRKQMVGYQARLSEKGQIAQFILSLMDGSHTAEAISESVAIRFPMRFSSWEDALELVMAQTKLYG